MRPRNTLACIALAAALAGCQPKGMANCRSCGGEGPPIDFNALYGEVEALFGGTRSGPIVDRPGREQDGIRFEPCAIAGETLALTLGVEAPPICRDGDVDTGRESCDAARQATYGLAGSLQVGSGEAMATTGNVYLASTEAGVWIEETALRPPDAAYADQGLQLSLDGDLLGEARVAAIVWSRLLSEEDEATVVWEVCAVTLE